MKQRSFFPLFATNFFGVANDNFLKTLASFTVIGWLADERAQSVFMGLTAGAPVFAFGRPPYRRIPQKEDLAPREMGGTSDHGGGDRGLYA